MYDYREFGVSRDRACVDAGFRGLPVQERDEILAYKPVVSNRYEMHMDVRCAVMMTSNMHKAYDNFDFSIFPRGDNVCMKIRPTRAADPNRKARKRRYFFKRG